MRAYLGDAEAQSNLGVMYTKGEGVPQDATEAVKWFRKAADQGDANAQHNLGLAYWAGAGVPKDYVNAHKWFNLAAATGDKEARSGVQDLSRLMQKEQIAEAQRLAREWHEAHSNQSEGTP